MLPRLMTPRGQGTHETFSGGGRAGALGAPALRGSQVGSRFSEPHGTAARLGCAYVCLSRGTRGLPDFPQSVSDLKKKKTS